MIYSGATIVLGLVFPHLEYRYLKDFAHGVTVPVATALFSSIASGMLALTGIVFSLAFVMLQFSRAAYFTPSDFLAQPRSRHLARIGKVHRYLSRFNFKLS